MEKTIENKARFFALYWGLEYTGSDKYSHIMPDTWNEFPSFIDDQYLILKTISSISDEDAQRLGFRCAEHFKIDANEYGRKDELRLLGYAIEWCDLSVEKQIEHGWIKLKSE